MKQALRNSGIFALIALFVFGFSTTLLAGKNPGKKTGDESNIQLRFIGSIKDQPVFQLNLANKDAEEYFITITDLDGTVLYSDKVKGTNIVKKFAINTSEVGDNTLRFEIRNKSSNVKESYTINRTTNYVVESSITRVN